MTEEREKVLDTPDPTSRTVSIYVQNVDVELLREQRDTLLGVIDKNCALIKQAESFEALMSTDDHTEALDGIVNMLDTMLDLAELESSSEEQDVSKSSALAETGETDYKLGPDYTSCWVSIKNISVYIQKTDEGVAVDLWPLECEDMDLSLASTWYTFAEAQEEINCRKARDIGA
jgi:hypothetical protein